ncbi:MAG TPA: ATP-binding protein, partial [Acetobacteraceae bacterium]|nr:ATP-binding protein [Acetobacteraceae bacterium]
MSRSKPSRPTTASPPGSPDGQPAAIAPALLAAVAAAPTGVVISDPNLPDCPIVYANPAFHRLTGYAPEEVIGRNCRFLQGPRTSRAAVDAIRAAVAAAQPIDIRIANRRKDGSLFVNELHISPVFGPDGRVDHFLGIQHDVTERVRAEQAAARARRAAERAHAEKSDLLAFTSHEVRTPLNGVLGTLSLLLDTGLDSEQRAYAETARQCAEALLATVNEILDLSRIEAGRLEVERIPFDLAAPVEEVLALLAPAASEKGLSLGAAIAPDLPARVLGDPQRLRQVLLNLGDNAVKFTSRGGVAFRLSRGEGEGNGERLVAEVHDTGVGIPASLRRRLFRRFAQADAGTARRHGGSGLGLMICRRLVGLMGGTIGIESREGEGSTFRFDLPLIAAADSAGAAPARLAPPVRPKRTPAARGRLLLAEDGQANQLVAAAILRRAGFAVDLARDGEEAVEAVRTHAYDAVLMDVRMPVLDGFEATSRIRALPEPAGRVPILALTAAAMPGDAERCLSGGMDAYLAKPVDRDGLLAAVDALLEGRPRRARAPEPGAGAALLDHATLAELRAAVGPGRLPQLLDIFAEETQARLGRLTPGQDRAVIEAEAHALAAAAGTFGAAALRDAARALEGAAGSDDT